MLDVALLIVEGALYLGLLLLLFRFRGTIGLGAFFAALGSLHFLETYLAATLYVPMPGGLSLSPGSVVLFAGKLALILLVYIREDAAVARQPIHGLIIGNLIGLAVVQIIRAHIALVPEMSADVGFLDSTGWLMLWGTTLLYLDCLLVILLYERLARWLGGHHTTSIVAALALVLTFDQVGFFAVLNLALGVPWSAGWGGWLGKLGASLFYGVLIGAYLHWFENRAEAPGTRRGFRDLFDLLTYRQRYEALREADRHDALTGALDRGELGRVTDRAMRTATRRREPFSLLVLDVDGFKKVNDVHGHQVGDQVLRDLTEAMLGAVRSGDHLIRYGGDEFVVVAARAGASEADALARRIAATIGLMPFETVHGVTLTAGIASYPADGTTLEALLSIADRRLYAAKRRRPMPVAGDLG